MPTTHTVQQGEYLSSIAQDYGFTDWHTIYDDPNNADLKTKRPNPNVLCPGDQLFIPDKQTGQESCATDQNHPFQVTVSKILLRIVLKDARGTALANQAYVLKGDSFSRSGSTDGNGLLQQEIPIGLQNVRLKLAKLGLCWTLNIGHLDPVHDEGGDAAIVSGVQARLNNLGYHCGQVDGQLGPKTIAALKDFQRSVMGRGSPSGEADQETRDALRGQHGC